jgi:hypothetical protein
MPRTSTQDNRFRLVKRLPLCRFCLAQASFETKTGNGAWSSMCPSDFRKRATASSEFRELVSWGGLCVQEAA